MKEQNALFHDKIEQLTRQIKDLESGDDVASGKNSGLSRKIPFPNFEEKINEVKQEMKNYINERI